MWLCISPSNSYTILFNLSTAFFIDLWCMLLLLLICIIFLLRLPIKDILLFIAWVEYIICSPFCWPLVCFLIPCINSSVLELKSASVPPIRELYHLSIILLISPVAEVVFNWLNGSAFLTCITILSITAPLSPLANSWPFSKTSLFITCLVGLKKVLESSFWPHLVYVLYESLTTPNLLTKSGSSFHFLGNCAVGSIVLFLNL